MHGSSVSYDKKNISFIGKSGSGKSSLVYHLMQMDSVELLSEDLLILNKDINIEKYCNFIKLSKISLMLLDVITI